MFVVLKKSYITPLTRFTVMPMNRVSLVVYKIPQDTGTAHKDFQSYGRSTLLAMHIFTLHKSEYIMYSHVYAVVAT